MGSTCEGTVWAKWPKTAWKLHNQHFGAKQWEDKPIFWVVP